MKILFYKNCVAHVLISVREWWSSEWLDNLLKIMSKFYIFFSKNKTTLLTIKYCNILKKTFFEKYHFEG